MKELEAQLAKEHQEQGFREATARAAEATARREREEEHNDDSLSLNSTTVMVEHGRTALVKLECLGIAACKGKLTLMATGAAARKSNGNSKHKNVHHRVIGRPLS